MKKHLATITILLKDRQASSNKLQNILTDNGHLIIARLGVNVQRACIDHCTGLIVLTLEGTSKEISDLNKKINKLYGIVSKECVINS